MLPHRIRYASVLLAVFLAGCGSEGPYPQRPILLVCPWAVGGGTDRVSRQIALFLEHELGVPVNVVNATGGAGVTGHNRGIRARPDGYTLTMMTVEINMFRWQGLTDISWEDFTPVMLVNRDPTALFVRADARWENLRELTDEVRSNPGTLTASGTATGGIWHLGLAGWLTRVGLGPDAIKWVPMNGAHPALQDLASGGLDLVSCSLPEARILLKNGDIRCLGVMADERTRQFPDVPTFKELGIDWSMGAWRGIGLPRGVRPEIVDTVAGALERIVRGETAVAGKRFPEFMENEGFNIAMLGPDEFRDFLGRTDHELAALLTSPEFAKLDSRAFDPMSFPILLFVALGVVLGAMLARKLLSPWVETEGSGIRDQGSPSRPSPSPSAPRPPTPDPQPLASDSPSGLSYRGILAFLEVTLAVLVYIALAERLGFVVTAAALLVYLLWRLGTRPLASVLITVLLVPAVYQLFANLLRVPLPRGLLGW